jgi:hypothetical protein
MNEFDLGIKYIHLHKNEEKKVNFEFDFSKSIFVGQVIVTTCVHAHGCVKYYANNRMETFQRMEHVLCNFAYIFTNYFDSIFI